MILIGGTGRNGTSVLSDVFASHPDVAAFGETRFFSDPGGLADLVEGRASLPDFRRAMTTVWWKRFPAPLRKAGAYTSESVGDLIDATLGQGVDAARAGAFVRALFGAGAQAAGRPRWCEKTPHSIRFADLWLRLFPQGYVIHALRNPADVCASMLRQRWGPKRVDEFPAYYRRVMARAWTAYRRADRDRYRVVRLEHIVAQPQAMVAALFEFAGLDAAPEIVAPAAALIRPEKAHVGRKTGELSRSERRLIAARCGDLYQQWLEAAWTP